jgi:hypothetical protein
MPLFGSRGGQPFYLAYQATPFPEIGAPVGLSGLAATMAPATSKKSSSSSSGKEDEGAGNTLFPGTTGVVKQINSLDNNNKLIESTIENVLSNKLEEAMKSGKDFSQFMEDEEVKGVVQQYQQLQYMKSQVKDLAPISNTDYRQIEATREIAKENKSGNTLAMKKVGSVYMPVQTLGDNERIHMSTIDEYLSRESERQDKIKVDKDGKVTYNKSYLPPVVDVTGEWQKATDELGARAKMSSSGGIGTQVFESEPGNPLSQIAYLTNVESGSNFGAIRAAAISLSDSMTDPQLQSLDADIHRDIEAGDAKIFDVDEKGNITGTRYINEQERSDIRRVLTNDFEGVPDEEKERAWNVYQNTIMNGRAVKINERLAVQKQSESKVTAGSKLWDRNSGEGLPNADNEYWAGVAGDMPASNETIIRGKDGSIIDVKLDKRPETTGRISTPGGTVLISFAGRWWSGINSKGVQTLNKNLTDQLLAGNPASALSFGRNSVSTNNYIVPQGLLQKMHVMGVTGTVAEKIMPVQGEDGLYQYAAVSRGGGAYGSNADLAKYSKQAYAVWEDAFKKYTSKGMETNAARAAADKDEDAYYNSVIASPVKKSVGMIVYISKDDYKNLGKDFRKSYDFVETSLPGTNGKEGKTVYSTTIWMEAPEDMYRWDQGAYKQSATTVDQARNTMGL